MATYRNTESETISTRDDHPTSAGAAARAVKRDVHALYLAARDPRVPWYAKLLVAFVAAYALSPIDLIPDFVPVLGYLDDLLIVPVGVVLAIKLIPVEIMAEHRAIAAREQPQPPSRAAVLIVVAIWIALATLTVWLRTSRYRPCRPGTRNAAAWSWLPM